MSFLCRFYIFNLNIFEAIEYFLFVFTSSTAFHSGCHNEGTLPFNFKLVVEQLNVIFGKNRSVGDTSMKFGMKVVCKSLFQKKVLAIKNSNMAAIFFKMVARSLKIAKNSKNRSSLSIYFQLLGRAE